MLLLAAAVGTALGSWMRTSVLVGLMEIIYREVKAREYLRKNAQRFKGGLPSLDRDPAWQNNQDGRSSGA